jgi:GWxTD domain-containing protein
VYYQGTRVRMRPRKYSILALLLVAGCIPVTTRLFSAPWRDRQSKEEKRKRKAEQAENESAYKHWIDEEVPYIITPEERAAWKKLSTDEEREQFIEAFWERRNPNPGSPENEYKEEYYRRIAYSNEHFASGIPGWKTDRGRIYIMYGPPDEIDSHPSGGTYIRPESEGGGETSTYPFEDWRYRYIDGIGNNVILEFVDDSQSGEYRLTMDPGDKDALLHVPNAGLTEMEQMGMATKAQRFTNTNGMTIGPTMGGQPESMEEFTRLDLFAKIFRPPEVKFKDMQAVVTSKLSAQLLPFDVRTDFVRVTDSTVLTPITVQMANRDLQFENKDGVMHCVIDIFMQLSTLAGRIVNTSEKSLVLDVPQSEFQIWSTHRSVYQESIPLSPNLYKLSVVLKDDASGKMGSMELRVKVPKYDDDKLSASSLILADQIQPLPTSRVGSGPFVIGGTRVRPNVTDIFTHDQNLGIYMQVYNLMEDPKTHKSSADVRYVISKDGKELLDQPEDPQKLSAGTQQLTLEKTLPVKLLQPGHYTVQIKVTDNLRKETLSPTATFEVQ